MVSALKVFTFEEVVKHNKINDCWVILNGQVYNVTPFMDEHPGGDDILLLASGKDGTPDFEGVGHSKTARAMMKKYLIGEIADMATVPLKRAPVYIPPRKPAYGVDKTPEFLIKLLLILATIALGVTYAARLYTKEN